MYLRGLFKVTLERTKTGNVDRGKVKKGKSKTGNDFGKVYNSIFSRISIEINVIEMYLLTFCMQFCFVYGIT